MKRKVFAAFVLALIVTVSVFTITRFSFDEIMVTVSNLSSPNEKLVKLNKVFEEITMLDQQQRAEAIRNPEKPYKYFLDQTGYLRLMIDSLQQLPWDSVQKKRLLAMTEILDQRNASFVSYLKVKADLSNNREFSAQLDTLALLVKEAQDGRDSSVITTQKKTITTYLQPDSAKTAKNKNFLRRLFSKKKNTTEQKSQVQVKEEVNVTVDTLAVAKQNMDMVEIQKLMRDLEIDQASQRKRLQRKELELIHANGIFISQLLNTLHEVEKEEFLLMQNNNQHAVQIMNQSVSRMNIVLICFVIGVALLVYLIFIDISKSNFYKRQLERSKNEAEELSKIKQRFLANMSHEIRTPLQSIIGFAEQLKQESRQKNDAVEAIHTSSEHLLHIVNEVLDYSRISSGNFALAKERFKLLALVKEVESAMRIQASRKGLTFLIDTEKATEHNLLGDTFRLKQIFYNLLGNAIKFTHKGFIKLALRTEDDGDSVTCFFDVIDTGIGMTIEEREKVFNQFEQANADITKQYGGTGLGLSIVKALVDAQGGTLEVDSEPGIGTQFSLRLRLEKAVTAQEVQTPAQRSAPLSAPAKIIVVDDDNMILKLVSLILKKHQIEHVTFNDPVKLAEASVDPAVTHIFMDIRMPNMTGVELCERLRPRYSKRTKFIALTAHVLPEERDALVQQGFDMVLPKPFYERDLLDLLGKTNDTYEDVEQPDFSMIRKMTMGDESLFQSIMTQFVSDTTEDAGKLEHSLQSNDSKEAREAVHKMAGRFGQVGIYSLSAQLHDMEVHLVEGKSISTLKTDAQHVLKNVNTLLRNLHVAK